MEEGGIAWTNSAGYEHPAPAVHEHAKQSDATCGRIDNNLQRGLPEAARAQAVRLLNRCHDHAAQHRRQRRRHFCRVSEWVDS